MIEREAGVVRRDARLSRLESWNGRGAEELRPFWGAWRELGQEIEDSERSFRRAIEARMGLDTEEADPALLDRLRQASREVGRSPIAELAAASRRQALGDYESLRLEARERSRSMRLEMGPETQGARSG